MTSPNKACSHCTRDKSLDKDTLKDRFWAKVKKTDGCWVWTGTRAGTMLYGYLRLGGKRGKMVAAHRLSWKMHYGEIEGGAWVLHKCDNPPCVRPDHLWLGTRKENAMDMARKGRANRPSLTIKKCKRGHVFDLDNTRLRRCHGYEQYIGRHCRKCDAMRAQNRRDKKRGVPLKYPTL